MDRELLNHWRPILKALDEKRVMRPGEVQALYSERLNSPSKKIATRLLAEGPLDLNLLDAADYSKLILCGSRGSGKTTELTRLGQRLRDDFCVMQLDLAAALPDGSGSLPIVVLFGVASLKALEDWARPDDGGRRDSALAHRRLFADAVGRFLGQGVASIEAVGRWIDAIGVVSQVLPTPEAQATAGALAVTGPGLGAAGKLLAQLKADLQVLSDIGRGPLGRRLRPDQLDDARAVVDAVNLLLAELTEASGRPPLLLADGLDKKTELRDVLSALADTNVLLAVAAPVVLTGPVNLRHDPRFNGLSGQFAVEVLYNVPVLDAVDGNAQNDPRGIAVLHGILQRRLHHAELDALFSEAQIERAARMSSGIVRNFLELLRGAALKALERGGREIEDQDLTSSIRDLRLRLELAINESRLKVLRQVLRKGLLPGTEAGDELLFENYIACYPNGDLWYRPHEVLVDFVERKSSELETLRDRG